MLLAIGHVLNLISGTEMPEIAAWRVIAGVQDEHVFGEQPVVRLVHQSVRVAAYKLAVDPDRRKSIAAITTVSRPRPAGIGAAILVDKRIEPF